ncbi:GMC family oxidoreductase [Chromobacterium haemolyticum]|uniref:GMC family oxidoreductase n=1 Tax=Chromobacterium fluminis TaxID=3044269 RepID=A0ABX0L3L6_9NEIS|nr:GMC family oxidoreductase N-terminal domain-containing protein [Chromobacterium haemolyticum]NHR06427.1 GMC family oxidoreductase [Chromobacterium haemolyticum]
MRDYDYILIGAGSAGCVLTHRLIEAGKRVLLLEDGPPDNSPYIHMPAAFIKVLGSERTVTYRSEPQPEAAGRRIFVPQGRTLGGGSSVNAMVYIRGQAADYDDWAAQGCEGWDWTRVLPAFKKAESHMRLSEPYHGVDGPLKVSDTRYRHPLSLAFVQGAQEIGLAYNDDFNGREQAGVGFYHTTTFDGRRGSTAATYLAAVRQRSELDLRTACYVQKIGFDGRRACQVEWRDANGLQRARATAEIVLCAGALSSPKLLMLSGIGPAAQLREHGVAVLRDAPEVGANYQDHLEVSVYGRARAPISLLGQDRGLAALRHGLQWQLFRTGLLSSNVVESGGFVDTGGGGRPDIQFHVLPTLVGDVDREPLPGHGISINPCLLRPKSRGSVALAGADPAAPLRFDSGALREPEDLAGLLRGVKLARRILRAPSMRRLIAEELLPSPAEDADDARLEQHIRQFAKTVYHPVGTCRMGADADAVVDPRLRVKGVAGLRVCDASVMPSIVSGNTNAPVVMIAERCAEFMLSGQ